MGDLTINDRLILLSTYDKRDHFPFLVRTFPDLSGNIHNGKSHAVIVSQLMRFAKACSTWSDFTFRKRTLTSRLLTQGFVLATLRNCIKGKPKVKALVMKYNKTSENFKISCFTP
jgi:hypothetical protein